ncbi:arginase family protein [Herbidospora mongoliensis]|uniref:arginase family protein n=1 Tax=Herbidospora mongoliensis TaxID=688067 RepID=UPI00082DE61D|nr:arginase family protein [Herbidospora mongoliensis]
MTTVLCVPQWQGSASERAPRLAEGARRAAALVTADAVVTVPVPDTSPKLGGIRARDALIEIQRRTSEALAGIDDRVLTIGGDCAVDIPSIAAAHDRYGDALTVLWIDAHPDVYSPSTLPSGAFHGMVVRALLGDGPAGLVPARPLSPDQVIIAGERAGADSEHEYLKERGIRRYGVADLHHAFAGLTGPVYVHIDLDVLDPEAFDATCYPEPGGVHPDRLAELVAGLDGVVGAALTEYAPLEEVASEDDVIRALSAALTNAF